MLRVADAKASDARRQLIAEIFNTWHDRHHDMPTHAADLRDDVRTLLDPHGRGRQHVASVLGKLAGTRLAGALRQSVAVTQTRANRTLARLTPAPLLGGMREARARLEGMAARLDSVSPEAVLKRGYALVFDAAGKPLTTAAATPKGAAIRVRFADGEMRAVTEGGKGSSSQGRLDL